MLSLLLHHSLASHLCFTVLFTLIAAVDLLERMLDLNTKTRLDATQALAHEYLKQYADPNDEPTAEKYDQSFEDLDLSISEWKSKC